LNVSAAVPVFSLVRERTRGVSRATDTIAIAESTIEEMAFMFQTPFLRLKAKGRKILRANFKARTDK
jgi:hypothetical protein